MKEEIKEILDYLKIENGTIGSELSYEETHLLLDYITNLQEENERLKELCDKYEEEHANEFQCWKRDRKELLDKRAIIDKAVEYIEEHTNWFERNTIYETSEFDILISPKVLLNILQQEDEPMYLCMDCGCWFEEPFEGSCPKCHSGDICKGEDKE